MASRKNIVVLRKNIVVLNQNIVVLRQNIVVLHQNIYVLPAKVVRDVLAPARERHDPHKPLRLRTTFFGHVRFQEGP